MIRTYIVNIFYCSFQGNSIPFFLKASILFIGNLIFSYNISAQSSFAFDIPIKTYYQAQHNVETDDDSLFHCEMEPARLNFTFDYGWNMYLVQSRDVTIWAGVSFFKDITLYEDDNAHPIITVRPRIGCGIAYLLAEVTGKLYWTSDNYLSSGLSYQDFLGNENLGRYNYDYMPYVERKNTFFVAGYGHASDDSFVEFQLRINLKKTIITPWSDYHMTPEPMEHIAPKRYFSLAVLWGMHF